jgi:hypothetical protein
MLRVWKPLLGLPDGSGSVSRFWLQRVYLGFVASLLGRSVDIRGVPGKITEVPLRGAPGFLLGVSLESL